MPCRIADWCELALEDTHDALERQFCRGVVEAIASAGAPYRAHDPRGSESRHYLLQN
jgi:hypothetical protein